MQSFKPTVVQLRLQLRFFTIHAIPRFKPTVVQLRQNSSIKTPVGFKPTVVQLRRFL